MEPRLIIYVWYLDQG